MPMYPSTYQNCGVKTCVSQTCLSAQIDTRLARHRKNEFLYSTCYQGLWFREDQTLCFSGAGILNRFPHLCNPLLPCPGAAR